MKHIKKENVQEMFPEDCLKMYPKNQSKQSLEKLEIIKPVFYTFHLML